MKADAEHQQDDTYLCELRRKRLVGDEPGRERADDDAGQEVADDRRHLDPVGNPGKKEGEP